MVELNDLIQIHEEALEPNVCDFLVNLFDTQFEFQEKIENDRRPNFTQFNLTENRELSEEVNNVQNYLIQKTLEYRDSYYEFMNKGVFPESHAFEHYRIKRYSPEENEAFDTHVDVQDYETARRFLAFMWYLNDVEAGGQTEFIDLTVVPKRGTLIIFPPMWMFPHRGLEPNSNSKYILSTYLHYK